MNQHLQRFFSLSFTVLLLSALAWAQGNQIAPETIQGGVLNGKAKKLEIPKYPPAARAVNAEGAVSVQVTIDEDGKVISAAAVSGHPLLRDAAVQAAQASKFSPTLLSGQPVKVTGVIVYYFSTSPNFNRKTDWFNLGNLFGNLNTTPTLRYFDTISVARSLPSEWLFEQEQLKRLEELKQIEMQNSGNKPQERVIGETTTKEKEGLSSSTQVTNIVISPNSKASPEIAAIGQSLIESVRGRLATNNLNLWRFNLGLNFNQALLNADSQSKDLRLNGTQPLRQFIETAPVEIPKDLNEELRLAISLMEKGIFTDEDRVQLSQSLTKIQMLLK